MDTIFEGVAGSHLFGTNTEKSDRDYKGIYVPTNREILLHSFKESIDLSTNNTGEKNTSLDKDVVYYSLCKYFKLLEKGETVALEMLFSPKDCIIKSSFVWDLIVKNRSEFLHKGTMAFIGFARTQANKYGQKGHRMSAIKDALELFSLEGKPWQRVIDVYMKESFYDLLIKHPSLIRVVMCPSSKDGQPLEHLEICGRKFPFTVNVEYVVEALTYLLEAYGHRAKKAQQDGGVDWKSISHAFRVCYQGQELMRSGIITLPLEKDQRRFVLDVKNGNKTIQECESLLDDELLKLEEMTEESSLPLTPNRKLMDDIICNTYSARIKIT
jgi:predicted nucleotidyltransferase